MQLRKRDFVGQKDQTVTQREVTNRLLSRKAAGEGIVLLKNEEGLLPIATDKKIAIYGAGAGKTVKGGTGSGDINERDYVTLYQGLINAGYTVTSGEWVKEYDEIYKNARLAWKNEIMEKLKTMDNFFLAYSSTPFMMPCGNPIDEKKAAEDGADTAVYVLSRIAGENIDRRDIKGDFYISDEEKALLEQICRCYKNVVLAVNVGGLVDLSFADEMPNIKAIMFVVAGGQEGGNAFADVLSGRVCPSGKLTDTWAKCYRDYPSSDIFSFKSGNVFREDYKEDIYVGYRYFDTFEIRPRYSFGFGLSYTDFEIKFTDITVSEIPMGRPKISVSVQVTNIGKTAGKEVVQVYVSCPQGEMPKEFRRLAAFGKTDSLRPGASQQITLTFNADLLSSYDESKARWILEGGQYGIWIGNSLRDCRLSASLVLDKKAVLVQCDNICVPQETLSLLSQNTDRAVEREKQWRDKAQTLPAVSMEADWFSCKTVEYSQIGQLPVDKAGEIASSLIEEQLVKLATGVVIEGGDSALGSAGKTVAGAAAETTAEFAKNPWNIASIVLADGPAGLRLCRSYQVENGKLADMNFLDSLEGGFFAPEKEQKGTTYYQYCTGIPVGTMLAQTWNTDILQQIGVLIGEEMNLFEVSLWLAPGMNIHRNPLCGRNFEYYSEDPLVAGIMASAITLGVQSVPGCGTTIKHFACNNQEDNRMGSDSVISERALREIYLKGFEIAVKNSQPMSIMTSYNMINGVHAANSYDLCTKVARDEWDFKGAIMTDWTTTTGSTAGECTASGCMYAGNDMVMPGDISDHENIRKSLADGSLDIRYLRRCVRNTINIILQSNQYESPNSYSSQFDNMGKYMVCKK